MLQLVKFGAEWCGPCKKLAPVFAEISREYKGRVLTYEVDVDQAPQVAQRYGVMSVPTVVLLDGNDQVVATRSGAITKRAIIEMIEAHLS